MPSNATKPETDGEVKEKTEAEKQRDELLGGAEDTTAKKGRSKNYEKKGGDEKAQEDFSNLDLKDVKEIDTKYGNGKQGTDSDGNSVIYRPGSRTGGSTIEIQLPGHNKIKIRY